MRASVGSLPGAGRIVLTATMPAAAPAVAAVIKRVANPVFRSMPRGIGETANALFVPAAGPAAPSQGDPSGQADRRSVTAVRDDSRDLLDPISTTNPVRALLPVAGKSEATVGIDRHIDDEADAEPFLSDGPLVAGGVAS